MIRPKIVEFPVPTPLPEGRLTLTVDETAARLGVSSRTIRNYIDRGLLPAIRFGGRVLVPVSGLLTALDRATEWQR